MRILRTRFKREIVTEFAVPAGRSRRAIIFCGGMPSVPSQKELFEFFVEKGYWVFFPRYRGSWESGGRFLAQSPHQDILDVINQLPEGFIDLWGGRSYKLTPSALYVIGNSFGGPAALLACLDQRVAKIVAISSVVDWTVPSKEEPLDFLEKFVETAYGCGYRFSAKDWKKLSKGNFYNPVNCHDEIDGQKVFMIHAKDDTIVPYPPVKEFADKINCQFLALKDGGHLGIKDVFKQRRLRTRVVEFLH